MPPLRANYALRPFDPHAASAQTWASYHAYRRRRQAELRPDDPVTPDHEVELRLKRDDHVMDERRVLGQVDDEVVGSIGYGWMKPGAPGYESNAKFGQLDLHVVPEHRRHGLGTALLAAAAADFAAADKSVLNAFTETDAGNAFLRHYGFEARFQAAENRLDLTQVDWDMVAKWATEGAARSPTTTLECYERRLPDDNLEEICAAMSAMMNTIPFEDLEHGEIVITPEMIRHELYHYFDQVDGAHHTYLTREADGSISGLTDVQYIPSKPDRVGQNFTGVRPDCRGRGLGKWLKAAMLQYIRRSYPNVRWITTGNANSNDPMLAINRQLGFRTYRGSNGYQVELAALRAALARA